MFQYQCLIFYIISLIFTQVTAQYYDIIPNQLDSAEQNVELEDIILLTKKITQDKKQHSENPEEPDKVKVELYYECLCPDCRLFDGMHFAPTIKRLGDNLDVHLYPYGNARTTVQPDGKLNITCQHGPAECYGNMLHACAIDILNNITNAVIFNACMMDYSQSNKGSDDAAAEKCGKQMNVNYESIKQCAKSERGFNLLNYYGEESRKVNFNSVPYILINGVSNDGDNFLRDVCAAFKTTPKECME